MCNTLPTHFRFLKKKEAKEQGHTINDWIPIEEINDFSSEFPQIAALSFAWITFNRKKPNLEFSIRPIYKCRVCEEEPVEKEGEVCESCENEMEQEDEPITKLWALVEDENWDDEDDW